MGSGIFYFGKETVMTRNARNAAKFFAHAAVGLLGFIGVETQAEILVAQTRTEES
jgi:hypothetical protein